MNRNDYFDFLKGIAILMVIGIHTFIGGGFSSWHEYLNTGVRQILNCAVPVFIACSGFFLANKSLKNKVEIRGFYKKQISRVYLPCLLWSLPWFALYLVGGKNPTIGVLNLLFCGFTIFYFVILMIQYYLLLPVVLRLKNRMGGGLLVLSLVCSLVCVAVVMYITAIKNIKLPLTLYAGSFPLWIVFFVLGVIMAGKNRDYKNGLILAGLVTALLFQIIEARYLCLQSLHGIGFGIKLSSFVFSVLVILLLFSKRIESTYNNDNRFNRLIAYIGRVSFVVYLSHTLVILLIARFSYWDNLMWSVRFLIVAVLDVSLVAFLHHVTPNKLKRLVGF